MLRTSCAASLGTGREGRGQAQLTGAEHGSVFQCSCNLGTSESPAFTGTTGPRTLNISRWEQVAQCPTYLPAIVTAVLLCVYCAVPWWTVVQYSWELLYLAHSRAHALYVVCVSRVCDTVGFMTYRCSPGTELSIGQELTVPAHWVFKTLSFFFVCLFPGRQNLCSKSCSFS